MSLKELYSTFNVDVAPQGDTRFRDTWLNSICPYCTGGFGYHLGYNLEYNYYNCYRCGFHPVVDTIAKLIGQDKKTAYRLMKEYDVSLMSYRISSHSAKDAKIGLKPFKYPSNITPLKNTHKRYLESRGFDPPKIQRIFNLYATTNMSVLDKINYSFRILAPVFWESNPVTFQARDYTNKQEMRYLACPMEREMEHHKYILYMNPKGPAKKGFIVEGITDAWRFYKNGCCTFGIEYTPEQVRVIAKLYNEVFTIFDPERQAQRKAKQLKKDLQFRGVKVHNIKLESDPGSIDQEEADNITRDLNKKIYGFG